MYLVFTRMSGELPKATQVFGVRVTILVELCTLYLHACTVRVTVGDAALCCCTCFTYFER